MRCEEVKEMLPAYAGSTEGNLALRRHLARCFDCRTEMDRYESLTGALSELSGRAVDPPALLVRSLSAIPTSATRSEVVKRHLTKNKRRYAAGGLAVAIVTAASAAALARRPRPA